MVNNETVKDKKRIRVRDKLDRKWRGNAMQRNAVRKKAMDPSRLLVAAVV
jgi:uncharacterized protein YdeI (BOF family)